MTILQFPAGILVKRQDFGAMNFDLTFANQDSGAVQTAISGPQRWSCTMSSEELLDQDQAARWRTLVLSLKGRVNHLAVYDLLNPAPRGTVRGTLTAAAAAPAGASMLQINAGSSQAGKVFRMGDWIGVNQGGTNRQLLHLQQDYAVDGNGIVTVFFEPVLRVAVGQGSSIVWDKPTCLMKRNDATTTWASEGAVQGGFKLDLQEQWF
ncbi:hypothetical protein H4CHR_02983 [Variovorax sp. PBS-H4]|uniref:hypothetical protein n=1 Tax=Variovorax sp. PBS-H4 TaxID=434008 RepID=UPI001317FDA0|nr:hypothetical protein [Variovorax sp. PBS-H4]VTU32294.1 hypothetical protein H4CHR_02983 [Variovorax sp. PBS-H4]